MVEPERAAAALCDEPEVVGHEDERLARALELGELLERSVCEGFVPDGEHLVDEQHVRVAVRRDGESEPHGHAGGVRLDGSIEKLLDARKPHDIVEPSRDLLLRQPEQQARDLDVFPARDLRVEPGAELEQRGEPSPHRDGAARGPHDVCEQLKQRRLAGAVRADDPDRFTGSDREGDPIEGHDAALAPEAEAAGQQGRLQCAVGLAHIAPVDLGRIGDRDRRFRAAHASSARVSRRRSNVAAPTARATAAVPAIHSQPDDETGRK